MQKIPVNNLQQAAAKFMSLKFKSKPKIDQMSFDFINSVEYHKHNSVETDLLFRFMTQQYGDQDLMFFLFGRSLAERELRIKLATLKNNFDIRQQFIPTAKIEKISKIYFSNVAGSGDFTDADILASHFVN
jgi:hypothetical protein